MKKQLLFFAMMMLPLVASADSSGKCGANVYYTYSETNHTLTIYGSGSMSNYNGYSTHAPWYDYASDILFVVIEDGIKSIGDYAFIECYSLTSISIGGDVSTIGVRSFENCYNLVSITIPKVTIIKDYAFCLCSGLTSVNLGNGLTSIGNSAFDHCSKLSEIEFPNSLISLGEEAFENCGLTNIFIPDNIKTIGKSAFASCEELKSLHIGTGMTSISDGVFYNCIKLQSVTISNTIESIGRSAFNYCISLSSINIPNSVTTIEDAAFQNCYSLGEITLSDNLKNIKNSVFSGCKSLKSIIIPSKTEYIYHNVFEDCGLTEVRVFAPTPPSAFDDSFDNYNISLYVPENSIGLYLDTNPWGKFSVLKTLSGTDIEKKICEKPIISYANGKLTFSSATDGAICQYSITDTDIKAGSGNEIQLTVTYNISVYATKSGYDNSDAATATLCWIDLAPKTEGITNGIANVPANAVLIQSEGSNIYVQGVDDGTQVKVYSLNGTQVGSVVSQSGVATINTNLQSGSIAIVKIGQKSVKVMMK